MGTGQYCYFLWGLMVRSGGERIGAGGTQASFWSIPSAVTQPTLFSLLSASSLILLHATTLFIVYILAVPILYYSDRLVIVVSTHSTRFNI